MDTIISLDAKITERLRVAEKPGLLRNIALFLAHSGDSWFWFLGLALVIFWGDEYWKSRAVILFGAILVTATLVLILKFTIRRKRPEGELGQIYRKTDPHSFPSGHAARAIMIGVIGVIFGPTWFGIILMIWGPLVGLARVGIGVHYFSDVLAGWVIGILTGIFIPQIILSLV
jgi:undecaprenyl-diphosphatase